MSRCIGSSRTRSCRASRTANWILAKTTGDTVANRTAVTLDSGNVPDVITESIARVRTYVEKHQLADLQGLYGPGMPVDDFAPGLVSSLSADGAMYAVPYRWATNALIYNPKLFANAGISAPPATWSDFVADAKRLTGGDVVGTAWPDHAGRSAGPCSRGCVRPVVPQAVGSTSSFILRPARNSSKPSSTRRVSGIVSTHPVVS